MVAFQTMLVDLGSGLGQSLASVASGQQTQVCPHSSIHGEHCHLGAFYNLTDGIHGAALPNSFGCILEGVLARRNSWILLFIPLLPCSWLFNILLFSNPWTLSLPTLLNKIPTF